MPATAVAFSGGHFHPFTRNSNLSRTGEQPLFGSRLYVESLIQKVSEERERFHYLEASYEFASEAEHRFLEQNRYLVALLAEAVGHIRRIFGNERVPELRLYESREEMGASELAVRIPSSHSPSETLSLIDRLDEEWWLDVMDRANGKLFFTVEFV